MENMNHKNPFVRKLMSTYHSGNIQLQKSCRTFISKIFIFILVFLLLFALIFWFKFQSGFFRIRIGIFTGLSAFILYEYIYFIRKIIKKINMSITKNVIEWETTKTSTVNEEVILNNIIIQSTTNGKIEFLNKIIQKEFIDSIILMIVIFLSQLFY